MTTSSPPWRGLGVARRGGRPRLYLGRVGLGARDWGKGGVESKAFRYLPSPPPTEASSRNVSRPEDGPASLPIPREMRPIKVVFPLFSGWGRGEELGNGNAWSGTWASMGGSAVGIETFSGFKIVTSPRLTHMKWYQFASHCRESCPGSIKIMGWFWKLNDLNDAVCMFWCLCVTIANHSLLLTLVLR